jgi:hypothetical protein
MPSRTVQLPSSHKARRRGLLPRFGFWLSAALAGYLSFLALLTIPAVQTKYVSLPLPREALIDDFSRSLLYLYRVNIPFPKDLGRPEKYGFARQ